MIIFFIAFLAALALYAQKRLMERCLDSVEEDHWTDSRVVDPDEEFHIIISLKNRSRGFVPFLRATENLPYGLSFQGDVGNDPRHENAVTFTTWLAPRQEVQRELPVSASRRGRYFLQKLEIEGGDFLGINVRKRDYSVFREVVVAPRPAPEQAVSEVLGGFMGDVSVRRFIMEDPVLTLGYREYTGREPMKMISWSQSARGMGLMVKKYDYTVEPAVSVLLNVESREEDRDLLKELTERCFSIARTMCSTLEDRGIQYNFATNAVIAGGMTNLSSMSEGLGPRHFEGILEALGRATNSISCSADKLLEGSAAAGYGSARGRILITPDRTSLHPQVMDRLREISGGNLLVIVAEEVTPW